MFNPQRFKGTEPVEDVTEKVKAVKIAEKPTEVKTEVVDEVVVHNVKYTLGCWAVQSDETLFCSSGSSKVHQVSAEER